jgi:hypothetical protein
MNTVHATVLLMMLAFVKLDRRRPGGRVECSMFHSSFGCLYSPGTDNLFYN